MFELGLGGVQIGEQLDRSVFRLSVDRVHFGIQIGNMIKKVAHLRFIFFKLCVFSAAA